MPFSPFDPSRLEGRRPRFRLIPVRTLLPNLITLLALCAGLTAIRLAVEDKLEWAVAAIVFAALLDGIDGRLARMLKGTSRFGAELDSLADFVNFGVAPALMLYFWGLRTWGSGLDRGPGVCDLDGPALGALQRHGRRSEQASLGGQVLHRRAGARGCHHRAAADLPLFPWRAAPARHRTFHLGLYVRHCRADGLAATGVLRQARGQAGRARDGAAGLSHGGAVFRRADRVPVEGAHDRHPLYLASLPFGYLSYRQHERRDAASAAASSAPAGAYPRSGGEAPPLSPGHGEQPAD